LKKLLLLLLVLVVAALMWGLMRRNAPVSAQFVHVKKQTLVTTLPTNGKAEPIEWETARAPTAGLLSRVLVQDGQSVAAGAVLAEISDPTLSTDQQTAQAHLGEARANLAALEAGRPTDEVEIANSLDRARLDLAREQKELEVRQRLLAKQAATAQDVQEESDKVARLRNEIVGLEKRKSALVSVPAVEAARARVRAAEAELEQVRQRSALTVVHAPIAGQVYSLPVRAGAYVNAGDEVASVGRLDRLRVRVYVDEPLLGRVAKGQPVTIRWEALPGKEWLGRVERKPAEIHALGSRQVGEVLCTIENPGRDLIPGSNVDAEIRTAVVDNALVVPKEVLRHDAAGDYVLLLSGDTVQRRPVKTGNSTVTLMQIVDGLAEGDAVAMPTVGALEPGQRVAPVFQTVSWLRNSHYSAGSTQEL
jgi:HlyD family secretion protein